MQVKVFGKVVERMQREKDGVKTYSIVVEEPGTYPSVYQLSSKNAEKFGPANGIAAVGRMVTAHGWCNGRVEEVRRRDGTGTFKAYRYWFTLAKIEPGEVVNVAASVAETQGATAMPPKNNAAHPSYVVAGSSEAIAEDIPF